ncbi:hypothetical protein [Paenibacillus donghaensis]|uniref:Uncharacterized protein n=1 Tax=Paenibacillus donghaensis TaxID=414771 RepID=A0A2Z2KB20_9BACL|nr:hypothetical protein [Paenibacillus donghaensis]ASA22717.1 hypothetical protein B9T62_19110 [Paenibacillus donghaensis]
MNLFSLTTVGILDNVARKRIADIFPSLLDNVRYVVKDHLPYSINEIADGAYDNGIVYLHSRSILETAIHKIGHAIHYQLFNGEALGFHAYEIREFINHKEQFAEIFTEMIMKKSQNKQLDIQEEQCFKMILDYLSS